VTRVTFVSYDDVPALGGQGVMLGELRGALRDRGISVTTVSGRGEHAVRFKRRTGRGPLDFSIYLQRDPELLMQHAPEVVHIFGGPGGVLFTRALPVPLVYHAHHTYRQAHGPLSLKRALGLVEARAYRRAQRVLAVSSSTAAAVEEMGIPAERIAIVTSPVAVPEHSAAQREEARLLFVGRLEEEKGVLDAVAVMASLARERDDVRGCVIGSGRLEPLVRRRAAGGRITFLGRVDGATLQREYARASLLLMPSRYEGLGRTALEAQAAATPVVGYDVTGLRDAVGPGGVLVAPKDVAALRAACALLLDDPDRRAALGERGQAMVRAQYSPAATVDRLLGVYAAMLDDQRAATERSGRPARMVR
jgi:glycosyltransferase involved in cell wall biosynthesis